MSKHITGHTGLLCLLGSPVANSVSPEMHNEACEQMGLDYTYLAFDVPEDKMPEAVQGLRTIVLHAPEISDAGDTLSASLHIMFLPGMVIFHPLAPIVRSPCTASVILSSGTSNAREEVQKAAKKVCPSYEEDGVLSILKTLL